MSRIYWNWKNISGSFERLFQSIFRGWNDSDCWDLSVSTAEFLIPRLKKYKEINSEGSVCPGSLICKKYGKLDYAFNSNQEKELHEEWMQIVDKIIKTMELIAEEDLIDNGKERPEIDEGLDLFREYFLDLWD